MIYGVYAAKHRNKDVVNASQSGGAFTAISDVVLEMGGVVYGSVLDSNFKAVHVRAENKSQRDLMRGSKYVQSDLGSTFKQVKDDLISGKKVLFSGTPCQVAGLKKYIGANDEDLICLDIICHGVPSPMVWKDYLKWRQDNNSNRITNAEFRSKEMKGWHSHFEKISFENGTEQISSVYANIFYGHYALRPSCYHCHYKSLARPGDITIADCWGIERVNPNFDDNTGVSLILVNTEKGREILDISFERMIYIPQELQNVMQPCLEAPFQEPDDRELFWSDYKNKPFSYIARRYGKSNKERYLRIFIKRVRGKIRRLLWRK